MTPVTKQNMFAVVLAGFLSYGLYSLLTNNPEFLRADIQGALNQQDQGDIRYSLQNNTLIIKAGKSFQKVKGISALISYDPTKIQIEKSSARGNGAVDLTDEDGTMQVTISPSSSTIRVGSELFRVELQGTDTSQVVVNDVVVLFEDGTSDAVRVGVEN